MSGVSRKDFGPHLMLDGKYCNQEKLCSLPFVYQLLEELPLRMGMTKILPPVVLRFKDKWAKTEGVSGFVMIAESHISMHTFPDDDYIFIDIFSCRYFDTQKVMKFLKECFEIKELKVHLIERGKNFPQRVYASE